MVCDSAVAPTAPMGREQETVWNYQRAFERNLGLIDEEEQLRLRNSRVAIAGMGGVGGVHLMTLARLGIGRFTIADPDVFTVANFNRQYGATVPNLGRNKAEAMAEAALGVNPELDIRVMPSKVGPQNIDEFLSDADLYVDGLDFFATDVRRLVFGQAARQGVWSITAGPIGFSTAWITFDPKGMSFDKYFDMRDDMDELDRLVAFVIGLTPRATHLPYTDLSKASIAEQRGPSASLACRLASGVLAAEAIAVLLRPHETKPAPHFFQFDAYRRKLSRGRLAFGNRGVLQRIKRAVLKRRILGGFADDPGAV